jgi:DNA-binding response OmpR family regulator
MPTVLVVDDDPDARGLLEMFLVLQGFSVLTACNGLDALRQAHERLPSIILLDLMMPLMDGIGFRLEQQRRPSVRDIPIVCLSARPDAVQTSARLGFAECLSKPFDLDDVAAAIRRHCLA